MKRQELAPAKVNLTLDVGARRPDGYHEVVSVMQNVALYDTVTMESGTGEGISLTCDDAAIPADGSNLAWRAAEVFFHTTGVACDGLHITLEKSIPSQAGLGGGSSDAAAVLRGLRKLYAPELPMEALERMGMELGSDVPYCVRGGTVLVQGKGEQLLSLRALPECWFVVCKPQVSFSTAEMYRRLDEAGMAVHPDTRRMMDALQRRDLAEIFSQIGNVFEQVLPPGSEIFAIRDRLLTLGAGTACMSGSGSAVVGFFSQEEAARSSAAAMTEVPFVRCVGRG